MAQTTCRTCSQPLVWQDTDQGRRPFNPDGTPHRDSKPYSGKPAGSPAKERDIRRMAAMKTAAQLVGQFAQTHEEVKVEHVFPLADKVLAWLEKGGDATA